MRSNQSKRSLRVIVSSVIVLMVISLIGGLYFIASNVLLDRFAKLEERESNLNVERVRNTVEEQYAYLQSKLQDWAYWDDAYKFVQDGNKPFRDSNLTDNALPNLKIHLLIYTNEAKEIVAALQYDLDQQKPTPVTSEIKKLVSPDSTFLTFASLQDSHSAIVDLPEGPMLIVSKPVITSEQKGPAKGALIFGQLFNRSLVDKLEKVTRLKLIHVRAVEAKDDLKAYLDTNSAPGTIGLNRFSDSEIRGYTTFFNQDNKPSIVVRADMPRELMAQGRSTINYFIGALSIVGLVFGLVMLFLLERTVISRLVGLAKTVVDIGTSKQDGGRVEVRGNDELTEVSRSINSMLGTIEERSKKLKDIMDNVEFGFFICNSDLKIEAGFTKSCVTLLGKDDIEGSHLCQLLGFNEEKTQWYKTLFSQVIEDIFPEEASLGQLPDRVRLGGRALSLKARVLRNADTKVTGLLYSVTDITELERVEIENLEHKTLIKILKSPQAFQDFVKDVRQNIESMEREFAKDNQTGIRRILHTLKGNFGVFDLVAIARLIHEVEEQPTVLKSDIASIRTETKAFLEKYFEILHIAYDGKNDVVHTISEADIAELERLITKGGDVKDALTEHVKTMRLKPVKDVMGPIDDLVAQAASRLGKAVHFEIQGKDLRVEPEALKPILEVLPHLIKNAIDHGIEPDYARGDKPETGNVSLEFKRSGSHLEIRISDDGAGLNIERITEKAVQKGLIKKGDKQLSEAAIADFIFLDDFSTAETISEISGRGVGMASVKSAVSDCNGSIEVNSVSGKGCTFLISIPFHKNAPMTQRLAA